MSRNMIASFLNSLGEPDKTPTPYSRPGLANEAERMLFIVDIMRRELDYSERALGPSHMATEAIRECMRKIMIYHDGAIGLADGRP